jgi:hypothetical protein
MFLEEAARRFGQPFLIKTPPGLTTPVGFLSHKPVGVRQLANPNGV